VPASVASLVEGMGIFQKDGVVCAAKQKPLIQIIFVRGTMEMAQRARLLLHVLVARGSYVRMRSIALTERRSRVDRTA